MLIKSGLRKEIVLTICDILYYRRIGHRVFAITTKFFLFFVENLRSWNVVPMNLLLALIVSNLNGLYVLM